MDNVVNAEKYRKRGCNCSQTILCTYYQSCHLDEDTAFKIAEGLGAGAGVKSLCGAASAMAMVIGCLNSDGIANKGASKATSYKSVSIYMDAFKEKFGSLICSELKANKIPCDELIYECVKYIENYMEQSTE